MRTKFELAYNKPAMSPMSYECKAIVKMLLADNVDPEVRNVLLGIAERLQAGEHLGCGR